MPRIYIFYYEIIFLKIINIYMFKWIFISNFAGQYLLRLSSEATRIC